MLSSSITKLTGALAALRVLGAATCFVLAALITFRYPIYPASMAALMAIYAAALCKWPTLWLAVIPAMLPAFDLTPWTGWLSVGEYDLFGLVTVGVLLLRTRLWVEDFYLRGIPGAALGFTVLSALIGVVCGLTYATDIPRVSDLIYLRPDNALRLSHGLGLALLLFPFMRERQRSGEPIGVWFAAGMAAGLLMVSLATVIERALFPGLLDFSADYRVVATFSSMHLGGGHIGAYIAFTLPFLIVCLIRPRILTTGLMIFGAILASYALIVTFARTAYVATAIAIAVVLIGWTLLSKRKAIGSLVPIALFATAVTGMLLAAAVSSGIMAQRFGAWSPDLATREGNWNGGWQLRDNTVATTLFGMGLGTFPRVALARRSDGAVPSNYTIANDESGNYLSIAVGVPSYLDQKVPIISGEVYQLSAGVRSLDDRAVLTGALCDKLLLYSENCRFVRFKPNSRGSWERFNASLSAAGLARGMLVGAFRRPVVLSLFDEAPLSKSRN